MYSKIVYKDIAVSFWWPHGGGGNIFAHEFVRIVSQKIGKVEHVFEYCAGPSYIGFCLLANNLCDRLTLADVNPDVIVDIKKTIENNNLQDRVTVYQSDCLAAIPEHERWDLVVGNPPWDLTPGKDLRYNDPEGRVHREFYRDIAKFLKPDGSILLIEGGEFTQADDFNEMITVGGLRIVESWLAVPFFSILKDLQQYKGLNKALVILLRLTLSLRESYFIWSKRN